MLASTERHAGLLGPVADPVRHALSGAGKRVRGLLALAAYRAGLPRLGEPALRGLAAQLLARSAETLAELTGRASPFPGR